MNASDAYLLKDLMGPPPEIMAEILAMGKRFDEESIGPEIIDFVKTGR